MIPAVLLTLLFLPPSGGQDRAAACSAAAECRELAEAAAAREDYEVFHDLAWRVVQTSPKNDVAAMALLARAQSLSGRPGDALVMLQRLAALGVRTDAATSDDFRRVRALPGWAAFEASLAAMPEAAPAAPAVTPAAAANVPEPRPGAASATSAATPAKGGRPAPGSDVAAAEDAAPVAGAAEALRFTTAPFTPAGLAYDAVSERFLVGDRGASKLTVVDEASQRVANLAAAATAGFGQLTAFEIDRRQGDLWVISSAGAGDTRTSTLHKLQLVSGRVLYAIDLPDGSAPARFIDVAVTADSSVLVLDDLGRRIFVTRPRARTMTLAARLDLDGPVSLAPAPGDVVYVAAAGGVSRVDVASGRVRAVRAAADIRLTGLARLRWHRGALVGVQRAGGGEYRVVRMELDRAGQRVTRLAVLDRGVPMADPTAAALAGDDFFYLAADEGGAASSIVKRVHVR
jgi:hypothetical protein